MTDLEFEAFPKIPRLRRDCVITEKIDGTNAAVVIDDNGAVYAQSRKRVITPDDDNFGFARWAAENAGALVDVLGPGRHFGEWWGSGIQRGYGLTGGDKRFSLFNTKRWEDVESHGITGLGCVPVLYDGVFSDDAVECALAYLDACGSQAAPFDRPEGVVVFHAAANSMFKVLLEGDELPVAALNTAVAYIAAVVEHPAARIIVDDKTLENVADEILEWLKAGDQ